MAFEIVLKKRRSNTLFREFLRRFLRNKLGVAGLVTMVLILLMAIFSPFIIPYDYAKQDYDSTLQFPNSKHWFGTDNFGRDILSRIVYGSRYTMFIGFTIVTTAASLGTFLGFIAAYYKKFDNLIMRFMDIIIGVPTMCFCLSLISAMGVNMRNMIIALAISYLPNFVRIMRAQVLTLKEQEFIEAARCIGASNVRIMLRHILPNGMAPLIVQYTLTMVSSILMAAALSFIGLGVQPPTPEWGLMISDGRIYLGSKWYMTVIPGLAIIVTTFALNLLGDGLRDALDPRLKQ